jgi:transcriptional regulator GlxA family with amidase domain
MALTVGILLFDRAEELDFVGPWEVFAAAAQSAGDRVLGIAATRSPIQCEKGLRVLADVTYGEAPPLDVIVVPGGSGARQQIGNVETTRWLCDAASRCSWLTSVCTGSFLLAGAGLATRKRITTHHRFLDQLRALGTSEVVEGVRFVRDGNLVTAGGVLAGIEMALWIVEQVHGLAVANRTRDYVAYEMPH